MKFSNLKISTRIALILALITPITAWALIGDASRSLHFYRTAQLVDQQNAAANALIAGVYEILIERQFVSNALQAAGPATATDLQNIARYRGAARSKIDAAYALLRDQDFPNKAAAMAEFDAARAKAEQYRARSDDAIKLDKAQRDPDVVKSSYGVLSAFVGTAQKLWNGVLGNTSKLDTELARLANIRVLAWNLRETAGRERATISKALSAKGAIPAEDLTVIASIRAQVGMLWRLLEANLRPDDYASVTQGVKSAKEHYFGKFQPLADRMRKVSAEGAPYPMAIAEWAETTTPLLATLLDIMLGASTESEAYTAQLKSAALRTLVVNVSLLALGVALLLASLVISVWTIVRPLRALTKPLDELASGNFSVEIPGTERKDEIGRIACAMAIMEARVRSAVAGIKMSAREVSNASTEIATSTTDLSQRTEEQAASLEETSAVMAEIAAAVRKNSESAQEAHRSGSAVRAVAERGGEVAVRAIEAMSRIEQSSRKISDIMGVIEEIARQTNLLALNAAVEAARAGEAGRGFAVVAAEVRSLAQRSAQAAKDIERLILTSGEEVKDGVALVNQAGAALTEVRDAIAAVADIVAAIAAASAEQSSGVEEVNKALTQMDDLTQRNSALVEENAATAMTLDQQVKAMDEQVAYFQVEKPDPAQARSQAEPKAPVRTQPARNMPLAASAAA